MPAGRAFALRVFLIAFAAAIFLATGELALRIVYRDAGTRTLAGPGGQTFQHLVDPEGRRGRFDVGAKVAGTPRILILGDSITWGQGVRDWQDTWPEQLAQKLSAAGRPHQLAVAAVPGRDIPAHVEQFDHWGPQVQPDVLLYQWYVNDIEVDQHRPAIAHAWQRWGGHDWLRRASYLYFFIDNRMSMYLPPPDRTYVQYILDDYRPGTLEWAEFERYFHRLMTRAKELAPARYLLLYPQLPFKGTPPLQAIYDHVRALSQPHRLAIPPAAWYRSGGVPVDRAEAPWHQAVQVKAGTRGTVIETRDYYLPPGDVDVMVTANAAAAGTLGTLAAVDAVSNEVIASAPLSFGDGGHRWQDVPARVTLPAPGRAIRFRIISAAAADFELGAISVAVDYAFKVIDLSDALNRFDTHASIFDSHPNAQAHKVIAEQVFDALTRAEPRR